MDEVLKFLKDNPTYFLATVDADGNPQVRPFAKVRALRDVPRRRYRIVAFALIGVAFVALCALAVVQ